MAISILQRGSAADTDTGTTTVTLGSDVTVGSNIIVCVMTGTGVKPRDNLSNDYQTVYQCRGTTSTLHNYIYVAHNSIAGACTVTVTGDSNLCNVFVYEVSGLATKNCFDKVAMLEANSGTTDTSGTTETTTYANELVLAFFNYNGTTAITYTAGAGYSNLLAPTGQSSLYGCSEEKIVASTGTQVATVTQSVAGNGIVRGVIATFSDTSIAAKRSPLGERLRPNIFAPGQAR